MNDTDEEIDIEYMTRSTDEAMQRMKTAKIQCWIKAHRRMEWRQAMRLASLSEGRWEAKAVGWNAELGMKFKTYTALGRPRKRWNDEINDFLQTELKMP